MFVSVEQFVPTKGHNKGKPVPIVVLTNGKKYPLRISVNKIKIILQNRESVEFAIKQAGL